MQFKDEYEVLKSEVHSVKIANDEYRKLLKNKNSELTQLQRESESLTKM